MKIARSRVAYAKACSRGIRNLVVNFSPYFTSSKITTVSTCHLVVHIHVEQLTSSVAMPGYAFEQLKYGQSTNRRLDRKCKPNRIHR